MYIKHYKCTYLFIFKPLEHNTYESIVIEKNYHKILHNSEVDPLNVPRVRAYQLWINDRVNRHYNVIETIKTRNYHLKM